jgi:hypothetical protein
MNMTYDAPTVNGNLGAGKIMTKNLYHLVRVILIALIPFFLGALAAHAADEADAGPRGMVRFDAPATQNNKPLKFLARTAWPIKANDTTDTIVHLWTDAGPITPEQLKIVHEKKLHLFLLSPDFKEFYHLHPSPTQTPGEYRTNFVPRTNAMLRAWAEFTTDEGQKRVAADVNYADAKIAPLPFAQVVQITQGDLKFSIDFDDELLINKPVMGHVSILNAATYKPFKALQPILGAFAHIVAFGNDYVSVEHIHPMGDAPKDDASRAGPAVYFHLTPVRAGMLPIFVQFKIDDKDVIVPFVVRVAATTKKVRSHDLENKSRPEHQDSPEK